MLWFKHNFPYKIIVWIKVSYIGLTRSKGTLSGNGWMFVCVIRESKVFRASALLNEVWSPLRWLTETDCRETLPVNRVIWLPVNGAAPDFHMIDERWMRMGRCVVIALCGRTAILLWQSQTVCFQDFNPHVCSDVSRRNFTWSCCYMIWYDII